MPNPTNNPALSLEFEGPDAMFVELALFTFCETFAKDHADAAFTLDRMVKKYVANKEAYANGHGKNNHLPANHRHGICNNRQDRLPERPALRTIPGGKCQRRSTPD